MIMIEKAALVGMAKEKASVHGIEPMLVCSVAEQESDWNCYAMRYEPAFYSKYILPLIETGHVGPTEANARATSWGLGQVLGQVARECGFGGPFLSELCDPDIGLEYLCRHLSMIMSRTGNNVTETLLRYNGGGNELYPSQVQARMATYA